MKRTTSIIKKSILAAALVACATPCFAQTPAVTGWGDYKFFLDPGHSGRENRGLWGYSEAQKVLEVAKTTREYLLQYTDIPEDAIKMCRETEADVVSLEERSDMANAWGADFYYSIHSDASSTVNTTVTLFGGWRNNGVEIEKTPNGGKAFGEILNPNLTGVMRITTRGNWYDRCYYDKTPETHTNQYPYLSVNRRTTMPSILSEGGYHTIASQQQLNMNAQYKRLEGFAAFQTILKYRKLSLPVQTFLCGIITNSENNVPIDGATVSVEGQTYTTDTWESLFKDYTLNPDMIHNGFYLFENLEAGKTVEVTFSAPGFDPITRTATIKSNLEGTSNDNVTWLDVQLTSNAPAKVSTISVEDLSKVSLVEPIVITFSRNMDRASVEQALSIDNEGDITYKWENDYTLTIDVSHLTPLQTYNLTINGSIAKNSQTQQPFDGNGDGDGGDNYVLTFTMAEPDTEAPRVVSTDPIADGEVAFTLRPVVRIEFNEPIDWNEDNNGDCITVTDKDGNTYAGKTTHAVVADASVLHFYFNEDLPLDRCFLVTVNEGLKDLSGNATGKYMFRFLSEYRGIVSQETLLALDDVSGFWAPDGSGSSSGLTQEANSFSAASGLAATGSGSSCKLHYDFDKNSAAGSWMIREYHSSQNITKATNDGILTYWLYGDGSNNTVSATLRVRTGNKNGGLKYNLKPINFRGWHLMTWDLQNDSYEAFTGTDELAADWRFDSFIIRHQNTDNDPSAAPQAWSGDIYFDSMEFNKFDSEAVRNAKIDDITIESGAVGTIDANAIRVYRSGNVINVAAPSAINVVDVYNAAGTKVASSAPATGVAAINISDFARGLYIVNVKVGNATKSVKIVK